MMDHFDLCKITAKWILKKSDVCVFEYQSYQTSEFPDVLSWSGSTTLLFEIKINKQDFLKDFDKDSRQHLRDEQIKISGKKTHRWDSVLNKYVPSYCTGRQIFIKQKPHLGRFRYYVCPAELIDPSEVKYFGLYWYKKNRFYLKKKSEIFRNDIYSEQRILIHALRKKINVGNHLVLTKPYR